MSVLALRSAHATKFVQIKLASCLKKWECYKNTSTVRMNEMPRFYVAKLLLHHYRSDLAHTSDRCSSVIELYLSEI